MTAKTLEQEMISAMVTHLNSHELYSVQDDEEGYRLAAEISYKAGARWGFERGAQETRELIAREVTDHGLAMLNYGNEQRTDCSGELRYPGVVLASFAVKIRALPLPQLKGE